MQRATRCSLYALSAMFLAPFAVMLLWAWHGNKPRSILAFLLTAALGAVLVAGCTRTWRRFFLVYFPLFVLSVAYATYAVSFGIVPGRTLASLLVSTTWEEIEGLIGTGQGKWLILSLVALPAIYLLLAWRLPTWPIFSRTAFVAARVIVALSIPVAAYAAQDSIQLVDGIALNPVVGSLLFFTNHIPLARAEIHGANVDKIPYHATRVGEGEEVHIFIVGESARRGSWSAYGYQRPTTPYLDALKSEAIFLQDAVSDANLTRWAVPILLTGMTVQEVLTHKIRGNLLDLAKEAGYSTAWLINQDVRISTAIGISADHVKYPQQPQATVYGYQALDETLLPAYRRELGRHGTSRFIGMHIMESHWEYYRRYPDSFRRFGTDGKSPELNPKSLYQAGRPVESALLNAYDNSTLYADWFLKQVIEQARELEVPVTVTFVPDHGEDLPSLDGGFAGHGGPVYDKSQFEIPAFVWVNDAYAQTHPQTVAALKSNATRKIRSHNVFYALADLMGITWPGAVAELSFASDRFVPDSSNTYLVGGALQSHP